MRRSPSHRPRPGALRIAVAVCLASCWPSIAAPFFRTNDVVAFVGGASVVSADRAGMLETTLTLTHPGHRLRFRSLAWEGDTVFDQPRELNFPSITNLLRRCQATVVCAEFGSLEALDPGTRPDAYAIAYRHFLDDITATVPRVVLVVPPPFESKPPPLPDSTRANESLGQLAVVIRSLAAERHLPIVDLHAIFTRHPPATGWTHDGRELTTAGHQAVAAAWTQALGLASVPDPDPAVAATLWERADIAELHGAISAKNRLWFDTWRPMNWAFLAGDRTEQQASRDHRDRSIRWFPAEMEEFIPLLNEAEIRIESLAAQIRLVP